MGDLRRTRGTRSHGPGRAPAHPATRGETGRDEAILALQRKAGNGAVSAAFTVVRAPLELASQLMWSLQDVIPFDAWFALQSRIVYAISDLGTLQINVNTALIEAETKRLQAETAAMRERTDRLVDHNEGHPGSRPAERVRVLAEVARGLGDDIELTDRVFLERHPEREGAPLRPEDPADAELIAEWRKIRRSVVGPVLGSELVKLLRAVGPGTASGEAAAGKGAPKSGGA